MSKIFESHTTTVEMSAFVDARNALVEINFIVFLDGPKPASQGFGRSRVGGKVGKLYYILKTFTDLDDLIFSVMV